MEVGRKPKCCRRLFTDDDAERPTVEGNPAIDAFLAEEQRKSREKWNFDFERGVPLEGRYEWVRVAPPSPPPAKSVLSGAEARPPRAENVSPARPREGAEEGAAVVDAAGTEDGHVSRVAHGEGRSPSETEQ